MKLGRLFLAAALLAGLAPAAHALTRSSAPPKFSVPWGATAGTAYINYPVPIPSQIGITNCLASVTTGFPPLTFIPVNQGGCAPFGQDFNGILKQITLWNQWNAAGAAVPYDAGFSSSIGGYPEGTVLSNAATPSCVWISQIDNNLNDPDTGGSGWTGACPGGGLGGVSTGAANAQIVTTTPFVVQQNAQACFIAGFTNTSALQVNVNGGGYVAVVLRTVGGFQALTGGEVHGGMVTCVVNDGTQWELNTTAAGASLVAPDQTLSGGANVTSYNLGTFSTGNLNVDCGKGPLQYLTDAGTFTINAPSSDGSCLVQMTNTTGAVVPTFSGFRTNANTGEAIDTTSGHIFVLSIWRINGIASYTIKALQ